MRRAALALSPLLSLALLLTLSASALASEDDRYNDDDGYEETARVARVSLLRGDVSVRRAGSERWERAALNLPLVEGDRLATGADSHLEIQIDARNFVRVGEYATLDIVTLRDEGVALSLPEGTATLRLARFDGGREYFEIDAPGTTVAAERAGLYRLDVTGDGRVRVTVRSDGRARIYAEDSGFTLRDKRTAELVRAGGETDWTFSDAASFDSWDTWVDDREHYLAERLRYDGRDRYYDSAVWGAEELDAYGDWIEHRDYGHVWRPRTTVINNYYNWAPYRHGHWRWLPVYGWTWIGDEPWGWAPYHYGRWVYVNNYWCWAPRGYVGYRNRSWWRPALVAFVFVPGLRGEHVAWYPLGYRHRDPHSNYWRRALNTDRLHRKDPNDNLKGFGPHYQRAVSSLPAREFGAAGRGRPADLEIARKALSGEPVRGRLPVRPVDAPGENDSVVLTGKTGGRAPGSLRNATGGRSDAGALASAPPRQLNVRPTGAAKRQPGVALDGELRRGRLFNNREPIFGKTAKPGGATPGGDANGSGDGRTTGAVARPTRPVRTAPDANGGGDPTDKDARERIRPVRPVSPGPEDAGEKRPSWKSYPSEQPRRPDSGDDAGERRRARPETREEKRQPSYNPDPQPAPRYERPERKERPAPPPPREERYERPAPRHEPRPSPPPQREQPRPAPREERPAPQPQREEKRTAPEKRDGPARGKHNDND